MPKRSSSRVSIGCEPEASIRDSLEGQENGMAPDDSADKQPVFALFSFKNKKKRKIIRNQLQIALYVMKFNKKQI